MMISNVDQIVLLCVIVISNLLIFCIKFNKSGIIRYNNDIIKSISCYMSM